MIKIPKWKVYMVFIVCGLGILYSLPNVIHKSFYDALPDWMPKHPINLGLDLQGGSHLVLEVDLQTALKDRLALLVDDVRSQLRKQKIQYTNLKSSSSGISFKLMGGSDQTAIQKAAKEIDPTLTVTFPSADNDTVVIAYSEEALKQKAHSVVQQSREIVERRINEFGLAEPNIQTQGDDRIIVQLPGVQDPARIKELLGKTAKMTFHMVVSPGDERPAGGVLNLPMMDRGDPQEGQKLAVERKALLDGSNLIDSQPHINPERNTPEITFKFDTIGSKKFAEITRQNVGRRFAIVLDGRIIMAPVIRGVIPGGSGVIEGGFNMQQAQDLSLLMRAGALPAPLHPIEERTVGPDLGEDSIRAGQMATVTSIVIVSLFMLVAYALSGVVAIVGVFFNIILLIAAMSALGATLTLAGIAGIALTIGMAVDANILIFERIKEELRLGRAIHVAIDAGYERAMATIVDSNLTTLIGAAVLFYFGSGPVRGFAVTLALGIIISMFTAVTLTRVTYAWWINKRKPQELSI